MVWPPLSLRSGFVPLFYAIFEIRIRARNAFWPWLCYCMVKQIKWLKIGNIWVTTYLPNIFYQIECPFHTSNIIFWSFWLGFKSQYSWTIFKQTKKRIPKIFENSLEKYLVTFLSHLKKLQNLYSNSDLKSWIVSLVKNTTKQLLQWKLKYRK